MNKKLLACVLAGTMAISTASIAFAEDPDPNAPSAEKGSAFGTVTPAVTTEAQGAIIEFSVPAKLTVGLDPFQAGDKSGSQIYSLDQGIYNKSNIPIRVTVKAGIKLPDASTVSLKDDPADVSSTDITDTDKNAYVEMVAQAATATTDRSGAVVIEATKATGKDYAIAYEATGADTDAKVVLATTDGSTFTSEMSFALQAATYTTGRDGTTQTFSAMADNNKGIGCFRFMGSLNANAASWSASDMEAKVVFDVNGMGSAAYDTLLGDANDDVSADVKAVNVYSLGGATGGGSSTATLVGTATPTTFPTTSGSTTIAITAPSGKTAADMTVTNVAFALAKPADGGKPQTGNLTLTTDYTVDTSGSTVDVEVKCANNVGSYNWYAGSGVTGQTVTVTISLKDDENKVYTCTLTDVPVAAS